jgi:hypothetical protein
MNIVSMVRNKLEERRAQKAGVSVEKLKEYRKAKAKTLYLKGMEAERKADEKIIQAKQDIRARKEIDKAKAGPLPVRLFKAMQERKARIVKANPNKETAFGLGNGNVFTEGANRGAFELGNKQKKNPFQ